MKRVGVVWVRARPWLPVPLTVQDGYGQAKTPALLEREAI